MNVRLQVVLRGLVLALLLLALWDPSLPRPAPVDAIVLIDDSLSMTGRVEHWPLLAHDLARLPAGSRCAVVRFGAEPVPVLPLMPITDIPATAAPAPALDRTATDLATALAFGLRIAEPGRPAVLVLLSDGGASRDGTETVLQQAQAAGIPIYLLPSPPADADAWIDDLQVPHRVRAGARVPLAVSVAGSLPDAARVELRVNGRTQGAVSLQSTAGSPAMARFELEFATAGTQTVTATLQAPGDPVTENNALTRLINVAGPVPMLYLSAAAVPPPAAVSLQQGGWPVRLVEPSALAQQDLSAFGLIILDDIPVDAIEETGWRQIARAVQVQGVGLLVLGGPHSFGGGYRYSLLESLLPVTAESTRPQPPAAVLFVVDQSGSMDQRDGGLSRLALARRAVAETARTLQAGDQVGLLAFAAEPRWLLPLAPYPDPAAAIATHWQDRASGGTRLGPALLAAVDALAAAPVEQRLLVLLTDGFATDDAFAEVGRRIATANVDVIALAVGAADLTLLQRLTRLNAGVLLTVREFATLPRLMPQEVGQRRAAAVLGETAPQLRQSLPFPLPQDRPRLAGYRVTKPRPEAEVYLASAAGDPLLAAWQTGAGRVAVLPGGLGAWAADWWRWPEWGRFLGGLVEWVAGRDGNSLMELTVQESPGRVELLIDVVDTGGDWALADNVTLTVHDPLDRPVALAATPWAPGRFRAVLPAPMAGRYRVTASAGPHFLHEEFQHDAAGEYRSAVRGPANLERWRRHGWIHDWPATGPPVTTTSRSLRPLWLVAALLIYLMLIITERGGWARLARLQRAFST